MFGTDELVAMHGAGKIPWNSYGTIGEQLTPAAARCSCACSHTIIAPREWR